jgi:hypothetical protein
VSVSGNYEVSVSCTFDALSAEDAVNQFITWLHDNADSAGYRVEAPDGACILPPGASAWDGDDHADHEHETTSVFIDAADIGTLDLHQRMRDARTDLCATCRPADHPSCSMDVTCACCRTTIGRLDSY